MLVTTWIGSPLVALTLAESLDLGVALGTALLALGTFALARQARSQARATTKLAEVAEREFLTRTVPVVRVMRDERPDQADVRTVNEGESDERLVVRIENRGQAPAGIEQITMTPGGVGELADPGIPTPPVLEPNGEWDVNFDPGEEDKRRYARGIEVQIQVVYEAIGSGGRYRVRTWVKRDLEASFERWALLREESPIRVRG